MISQAVGPPAVRCLGTLSLTPSPESRWPVAAEALEQSMLESKDKEQLLAIAQALGIKTTSRAAKATLIVQVTKRDDSIRCVRAPCWVPAAGVKVTIVRDDQVVARRVSGKDGRFRIELDAGAAQDERALQPRWLPFTTQWLEQSGAAIAQAVNTAACLLDLEGVILDGSFSRELLAALLAHTERALVRYSWEGVSRPQLLAGTIGSDARALGGALLPLYANFAPDRDLFLKVEG